MKTALVYYSYEGNSAAAAEIIRAALNMVPADVFEIKTADNKKRTGLSKYIWGGSQVVMRKNPALLPLSVDINAYDVIILGAPVWAGAPAPPLVSFLKSNKITGKKIALFCCHAGGKRKALDKLKELVPENTIIGEIDFMNPAGADPAELKEKIARWVKTLGL